MKRKQRRIVHREFRQLNAPSVDESIRKYSLEDLIALRKFRKGKHGINVANLNQAEEKKGKRTRDEGESTPGGLSIPSSQSKYKAEEEE